MIKRIITQEEKDKKRKKEQIIWGVILAFLILFSSVGYAFLSRDDNKTEEEIFEYGGLEFVQNSGFWATQINNKVVYFGNLPTELSNVSIEGNYSFEDYYGKVVYFVNGQSGAELISYSLQGLSSRMQDACVDGFPCVNSELPVKTCNDSVIIFSSGYNQTRVYKNNNCVIIEGNSIMGADKLLYRLYNIA